MVFRARGALTLGVACAIGCGGDPGGGAPEDPGEFLYAAQVDGRYELRRFCIGSGEDATVLRMEEADLHTPMPDSDSDGWVAVAGHSSGRFFIAFSQAGEPTASLNIPGLPRWAAAPAPNPGDDRLLFEAPFPSGVQIWESSPDRLDIRTPAYRNAFQPRWLDSTRWVFLGERRRAFGFQLAEGTGIRPLAPLTAAVIGHYAVLPDGALAFADDAGILWRQPLDGSPESMEVPGGGRVHEVAAAPADSRLLLGMSDAAGDPGLWLWDPSADRPPRRLPVACCNAGEAAWVPQAYLRR